MQFEERSEDASSVGRRTTKSIESHSSGRFVQGHRNEHAEMNTVQDPKERCTLRYIVSAFGVSPKLVSIKGRFELVNLVGQQADRCWKDGTKAGTKALVWA